jgi:hypothetical protein
MIHTKAGSRKRTKLGLFKGYDGLSSKVGNNGREQTCPRRHYCFPEDTELCGKEESTKKKNGLVREI